jgi:hypothetical protein
VDDVCVWGGVCVGGVCVDGVCVDDVCVDDVCGGMVCGWMMCGWMMCGVTERTTDQMRDSGTPLTDRKSSSARN